MKKKIKITGLTGLGFVALLLLSACSSSNLTSETPGIWNQIVYYFAVIIRALSINGSIGIGIILFTLIIRTVLLPLMAIQMKSSQKMQEIQPEIKALQAKYPGRDADSRSMLAQEQQRLYAENNIHPLMGCLPMLVQLPFLYALYQALINVNFLKQGSFLWFHIGQPDHTFVLPILAAILTFLSSWLMMKANPEQGAMTWMMTIIFPIMIFFMAFRLQAGVALYWVIQSTYQVVQTLFISNPFKIIAEREAKAKAIKDKEKAKEKALRKAQKRKK